MQTAQNTQMQIIALAMKILGTKNESELQQALSQMSEVGRTKFIKQCQNIIQTGNTSQESIQQAQQLAQQAINEGPEQEYTQMAKYGKALNRYYFGGRVKTYDGNYMDLKKPVNKDQIDGKEAIGIYKGQWMYLNKNEVAVPKSRLKNKGYDGTAHINRAYNGMLLPRPYKYDFGGTLSNIGEGIWNGMKVGGKWVGDRAKDFWKFLTVTAPEGIDNFRQSTIEYGKKKGIKQPYFDAAAAKLNSWIPGLGAPLSFATDFLFNPDAAEIKTQQTSEPSLDESNMENLSTLSIEELIKRYVQANSQQRNVIMEEIRKKIPTQS